MLAALVAVLVAAAPTSGPRYEFEDGSKASLRLDIAQTATERVKTDESRVVLPQVLVDLDLSVSATADGATIAVRVPKVEVRTRKGVDAGAASALQKGFDDGPRLAFSVTVRRSGHTEVKLGDGITPSASTAETVQMIVEALRGLWPDLPDEAAEKWTVPSSRTDNGMTFTVSTEVRQVRGDGLRLAWTRSESLASPAPVPGAPKGMSARFESASSKTEGTVVLGKGSLPSAAESSGKGTLTMAGESGGKPFTIVLGEERTVRLVVR